jgi:type IV secretory pathway VirB10-like protein
MNRRPPSRHRTQYDRPEPKSKALAWSIYAGLALVGLCFGAWAGNQKPKVVEIVKTVPGEPKAPEAKPENKEPPKNQPEKKDPPKTEPPKPEPPKPEPMAKPEPTPEPKPEPKPDPKKPEPKPEPKTEAAPNVTAVAFDKEVLPIFKAKCNLCHGDTKGPKGGLDLRTLASIKKGGDSGDALVAGKIDKSLIWTSIDEGAMPPAGKPQLTDAEKTKIKNWILSGGK